MTLFIEQCLNGLQFGLLLFLLAAGLTLVFGIMDLVNLAHGSLYMVGAYFAATFAAWTGSFVLGAIAASSSYIDAPAAVRATLPQANPSIYLTSSLGITLPFNLIVGLPLYYEYARNLHLWWRP